MTPYEILGIAYDSTKGQIKAAYRKLSKTCHPDAPDGSDEQFTALNEAYELLMDEERRTRYDETGRTDINRVTPEKVRTVIETHFRSIIEDTRSDLEWANVVETLRIRATAARPQIKDNKLQVERKIVRNEAIIKRIIKKSKKGANILVEVLEKEKKRLENELLIQVDAEDLAAAVEEALEDYDYKVGPEPEGHSSPGPTPAFSAEGYSLSHMSVDDN